MKNLILFLFLFQLVTSHSQWSLGDYVDDFDIPTGETFLFQEVKGTKKSKLKKQDCHFFIEHNKKDQLLAITIHPYGDYRKEKWEEDTFQNFFLITPSGEQIVIETFCFDSILYFSEKEYDELMDAMKEKGKYRALCIYHEGKSKTHYAFNFEN